jgi:uncharacterized membrane protein YdbT with pleckstrin-like domain
MEEYVVRPSIALLKTAYGVAFFTLACIGGAKAMGFLKDFGQYWWVCFVPPVLYLLWIVVRHFRLTLTKLIINEDRIRLESGFLSKQMHAIDVSKVHNVRVEQSVKQRVMGIGNLTVETASQSSRIYITDIDKPQEIADRILQFSKRALQQRPPGAVGA